MKSLYSLIAVLACLVRPIVSQNDTSIVAPPDGSSCFANTTQIYEHLTDQPELSFNTYILCPNTVFNIGYVDSQGECCEDGYLPLTARSNTRFQCGEDGSSANNCTLMGGTIQLMMSQAAFGDVKAVNVVVEGITFTKAGLSTVPASLAGDLTLLDCIFEVRQTSKEVPSQKPFPTFFVSPHMGLYVWVELTKLGNHPRPL